MLSVADIQQWITEQHHEDDSDTVYTNALLLRWVNEAYFEVATAYSWKWLEGIGEFTLGTHGSGANTSLGVTYFPNYIQNIVDLYPSNLGYRRPVMIVGGWEMDMVSPSLTSGSISSYLAVYGYYGVARDNDQAATVTIADSGGSTIAVRVEGIDNNGLEVSETVTLVAGAGATASTFAAGPDGVRRVYLSSTTGAGTVVFTNTGSGTQLQTLDAAAGEQSKEHLRTELSPAPAATGANYVVRYKKRPRRVTGTTDLVDIPQEFENLLFHAMGRRLAMFRGEQAVYAMHEQAFRRRVDELKRWQNRDAGRLRGLRSLTATGYRHLRGW